MALLVLLALPAAVHGQRRCKGTKQWYRGKCRYPDEVRKIKQQLRRRRTPRPALAGVQWVLVRGGSFAMGSRSGASDARPVHRVSVGTFRLSKSEVTVGQYRSCVKSGRCSSPNSGKYCNWGRRGRSSHPVNCVDWSQARAFCSWAGGRLPSEAEWEYAARSGGKGWKYPWGDAAATCSRAVMDDGGNGCGKDRTWPVCSKTSGNTTHGLCDMAGNVWEWVEDCWHGSYSGAPVDGSAWTSNCSDASRVLRGGSWPDTAGNLRAALRVSYAPGNRDDDLGFRCAR